MTTVSSPAASTRSPHDSPPNPSLEQHGLLRTLLLYLGPGVAILAVYIGLEPLASSHGLPALFALLAAVTLAALPLELGHLLLVGRRRNGKWSLQGVVVLRARLRLWQYAVLVPLLLAWSFLVYGLLTPVSDGLSRTVFFWLPAWFFRDD